MKHLFLALFAALALLCATPVRAADTEPFGRTLGPVTDATWKDIVAIWQGMPLRLLRDSTVVLGCREDPRTCTPAAERLLALVRAARAWKGMERLEQVNSVVNKTITYAHDLDQWGEAERWSSALETLSTGRGDCEDYVLLKYLVLALSGTPVRDLRIGVVSHPLEKGVRRESHAVLAVRFEGRWRLLDIRVPAILSDAEVPHYTPHLLLDERGAQQYLPPAHTASR